MLAVPPFSIQPILLRLRHQSHVAHAAPTGGHRARTETALNEIHSSGV
jgi:hypothetical protein